MRKLLLKGLCQTLILMTALLLISVQSILFTFQLLSAAEFTQDENGSIQQKEMDGTEAAPPEESGWIEAEMADDAAPEAPEALSLREQLFHLAIQNPGSLRLLYAGMFLLIALYLLPDLFPWGKCAREFRLRTLLRAGLSLGCALPFLISGDTEAGFLIMNILYTVILAGDFVFRVMEKRTTGRIVRGALLCGLAMANLFLFPDLPFFVLSLIILWSLRQILRLAFPRIRMDVLRKIIRKTYAAEIIVGMFLLIITFSLLLSVVDDGIKNFGDALWFCFATVTTIGYGDVASVSVAGRILSVILGVYGIIVVALITSIIVNFYNETKTETKTETKASDPPMTTP